MRLAGGRNKARFVLIVWNLKGQILLMTHCYNSAFSQAPTSLFCSQHPVLAQDTLPVLAPGTWSHTFPTASVYFVICLFMVPSWPHGSENGEEAWGRCSDNGWKFADQKKKKKSSRSMQMSKRSVTQLNVNGSLLVQWFIFKLLLLLFLALIHCSY